MAAGFFEKTDEQEAILRRLRCDELQGYLYGHPLAAEEFAARMKRDGGMGESR